MQAFLHTLDTSGAPEQDTPGGTLNTAGHLSACPRHITPPDIPAEELNTSGHVRDPCGHVLDSPGDIRTYLDLNIWNLIEQRYDTDLANLKSDQDLDLESNL